MIAFRQWIVIAVILVNGYCFGANMVERFVNYQTWPMIGEQSFQAYHRAQAPLIQMFVVAPLGAGFILQLLLLTFYRHAHLSAVAVWTMLLSSAVGGISTILLQIPIHRQFDAEGFSGVSMRRLLWTDWIRKFADLARLIATIFVAKALMKAL